MSGISSKKDAPLLEGIGNPYSRLPRHNAQYPNLDLRQAEGRAHYFSTALRWEIFRCLPFLGIVHQMEYPAVSIIDGCDQAMYPWALDDAGAKLAASHQIA